MELVKLSINRVLLCCLCGLFYLTAQTQNTTPYTSTVRVNYVRMWDVMAPIQNANDVPSAPFKDVKQTTQYFDGLGRPLQTVVKKGSLVTNPSAPESSSGALDMVSAVVYDELGRERYKYLPFVANTAGSNSSTSDGLLKLNPFEQQSQFATAQYSGESFPYSKINFEPSPLNRAAEIYAPGNSWAGSEANTDPATRRNVSTQYLLNDANDAVRVWEISGGNFITNSTYSAGELFENVTIDEHKKKMVEYKDKEGKMILKKLQLGTSPTDAHDGWLCTYYIYDEFNQLRCVLQPRAVELLAASSWAMTSDILDEFAFQYQYDARKRLIVKKLPGAAEVRMVYDQWDRLVLMQDANIRVNNQWLFTKYDQYNRPIMTGFYTNTTYITQAAMQTQIDGAGMARYEVYQTATFPLYSLTQSFPSVSFSDINTITYYDDYSWASWYGSYSSKDNTWDAEFGNASNSNWPYPQALTQTSNTKGLVTGVWDKTGSGMITATFYDEKARAIQTKTLNYTAGLDIQTTQYSYSGQVLQTVLRHQKGGTNAQTHLVQTRIGYDEAGRIIKVEKKLNSTISATTISENWHTLATMEYDALGQLKTKKLAPNYGSSGLDELNYTYNIHGWLTGINKDYLASSGVDQHWFGMELGYNDDGYASFGNKQYNGNISGTIWRGRGDGERRKYDFAYDAVNRLMKADFTQ
ncbi:MAG TPA: DUF6443 domain-containing protein, partial [Chitinophagaceae bacterium]|nr:DUF6443 domain-containing protein [Chitinophagaceae bacterium]